MISKFKDFLPEMLKQRNAEIKKWYQESTNKLKGAAPTIDAFVQRSNALKVI